ncbi:UNVERIFIED_CONTAM: hypothetical protein FKN15_069291 [Acipenser sinensis]
MMSGIVALPTSWTADFQLTLSNHPVQGTRFLLHSALTGDCNGPLPCPGIGKGEAMASSSYYDNPDYSDPYSATGQPEAPPPDLCDKKPSARTGKRRTWGPSAPASRETVPAELPQVPPRQPLPQPQQPQQGP